LAAVGVSETGFAVDELGSAVFLTVSKFVTRDILKGSVTPGSTAAEAALMVCV
jgi:hypothetical protein